MVKKSKEYRLHNQPVQDINFLEPEATYSYADYLKWSFEDRVELIRGKLFRMAPAPSRDHQVLLSNLHGNFWSFLKDQVCRIFPAPFDVRFPEEKGLSEQDIFTVVQPDLCVVCDPSKLDEAGCVGAPDLIIEILSPSTSAKDLNNKFKLYEEYCVKEYWVVYPGEKVVELFQLDKNKAYSISKKYTQGDMIISSVLIGFELSIEEVFEGLV
tara:strand:+ start:751 stop:1386 length:636 start_codon:yes stop_codon:yes gene_type:complete